MRTCIPSIVKYVLLLAVITSCKKDKIDTPRTPALNDNVTIIDEELSQHLVEYKRNSLKFNNQSSAFAAIETGDILVSMGDPNIAPNGYLREITSILFEKNGTYTFYTKRASLLDLLKDGTIDTPVDLASKYYHICPIVYDADGKTFSTTDDQIIVDAGLRVDFGLDRLFIDIRDREAKIAIESRATIFDTLNVDIGLVFGTIEEEVDMFEIDLATIIIPIPGTPLRVPLTITFDLDAGVEGRVSSNFKFGFDVKGEYKKEITYDEEWNVDKPAEKSLIFNKSASASVNAEFEVYAKPGFEFTFFKEAIFDKDLIEFELYAKAYLKAQFDSNNLEDCNYYAGVRLGAEMDALFIGDVYEDDDIADFPYPLCEEEEEEEEEGLFKIYDGFTIINKPFKDVEVSNDGKEVWVTDGSEIYKWNEEDDTFKPQGFSEKVIRELILSEQFFGIVDDIALNPINNQIYIGLYSGTEGSSRIYTQEGDKFTLVLEDIGRLPWGDNIESLNFDKDGNLWFHDGNTDDGFIVYKFTPTTGDLSTVPITGDTSGDLSNISFQNFGDPLILGNTIYSLSTDNVTTEILDLDTIGGEFSNYDNVTWGAGGFLWIGGIKDDFFDQKVGLYRYNIEQKKLDFYENTQGITDGQISPYKPINIFAHKEGIWFSYEVNELYNWNGNELFVWTFDNSNLPMGNGGASNFVGDIVGEPDGAIWISYGEYMLRYDYN